MKCGSCSKAISGVYEVGSYSCSGCGGAVEVNPGKKKNPSRKNPDGGSPVRRIPDWSAPEFLRKYGRGLGSGSAKEWAEELKYEHPTNRQMVVGLVADLLYQMDTSQVDARNQGSAAFLERYQAWMEGPSAGVSTSPNVRFPFI